MITGYLYYTGGSYNNLYYCIIIILQSDYITLTILIIQIDNETLTILIIQGDCANYSYYTG